MEFYEVLKKRRSIRAFKSDPVPEEVIDRIMDAAILAPSACNLQPYRFLVITDPVLIGKLNETTRQKFIGTAPVIVVALGQKDAAWHRDGHSVMEFDLGIAMEHIILAAAAEDLASCYIGAFDVKAADQLLQVPDNWSTVMMTPIGYASGEPRPFTRKSVTELVEKIK